MTAIVGFEGTHVTFDPSTKSLLQPQTAVGPVRTETA